AVIPARDGFATMRRAYGPEHPVVATFMARLAAILHHAGHFAEADSLFRASIAMDKRLLGSNHVNVGGAQIDYARLLIQRHQYAAADSVLRDAVRIGERAGPNPFPAPLARKLLQQMSPPDGKRPGSDSVARN